MEPKEIEDIPRVDIIFCRNVMIYFSQNSRLPFIEYVLR